MDLLIAVLWCLLGGVALYISYRVGRRSGYKKGGTAVLNEWKEFNNKMFGEEEN